MATSVEISSAEAPTKKKPESTLLSKYAMYGKLEKDDVTRKLFFGNLALFPFLVVILSVGSMYDSGPTVAFSTLAMLLILCGLVLPRFPLSKNHFISDRAQMIIAEFYYFGLFVLFLWTWIGGIVLYAIIEDEVEDFCEECVKEGWRCSEQCVDDHTVIENWSYVFNTFSLVISTLICICFARWTVILARNIEKDSPTSRNAATDLLQKMWLPNLDPLVCCCCPRQQHIYTREALAEASDDIADAAEDTCSTLVLFCCHKNTLCACCCCCLCITWGFLIFLEFYCMDSVWDDDNTPDNIDDYDNNDFAKATCWITNFMLLFR